MSDRGSLTCLLLLLYNFHILNAYLRRGNLINEENLSAQKKKKEKSSRILKKNEYSGRTPGYKTAQAEDEKKA
jgi:hypothetical protein